jgi:hypothetical protein
MDIHRYATHNLGLAPVFSAAPVKFVWIFFVALFRSHAVCNMVATAVTVLKAGMSSYALHVRHVLFTIQSLNKYFELLCSLLILEAGFICFS